MDDVADSGAPVLIVAEWNYFDYHRERWGLLRWPALIPAFRRNFNNRIVHFRFD